jgi:hypothetical protein
LVGMFTSIEGIAVGDKVARAEISTPSKLTAPGGRGSKDVRI